MTRLRLLLPGASITSSSSRAHAPTMRHALSPSGQVICVGELGLDARVEVGLGLELELEEDRALRHRPRTARGTSDHSRRGAQQPPQARIPHDALARPSPLHTADSLVHGAQLQTSHERTERHDAHGTRHAARADKSALQSAHPASDARSHMQAGASTGASAVASAQSAPAPVTSDTQATPACTRIPAPQTPPAPGDRHDGKALSARESSRHPFLLATAAAARRRRQLVAAAQRQHNRRSHGSMVASGCRW